MRREKRLQAGKLMENNKVKTLITTRKNRIRNIKVKRKHFGAIKIKNNINGQKYIPKYKIKNTDWEKQVRTILTENRNKTIKRTKTRNRTRNNRI